MIEGGEARWELNQSSPWLEICEFEEEIKQVLEFLNFHVNLAIHGSFGGWVTTLGVAPSMAGRRWWRRGEDRKSLDPRGALVGQ